MDDTLRLESDQENRGDYVYGSRNVQADVGEAAGAVKPRPRGIG
jgi:hypothetical protein